MILTIAPTDDDIFRSLEAFLLQLLPSGDAVFNGSVSGTVLTVREMEEGTIQLGDALLGPNVEPNTIIESQQSGEPGGAGNYTVSPDQGLTALSGTMATGVEIIQSQINRVPEPKVADFVEMTILRFPRLSTNVESYADVTFTGSIAGNVLTIATEGHGTLNQGHPVFGPGVVPGTSVRAPGPDPGTWFVAPAQSISSQLLAAGFKNLTQSSQCVLQLDVHGPNSSNYAMIIATVFRSETATDIFTALNPAIAPLYADDPKQMPFNSGEQQYEGRYIIEVNLQVNQTVSIGQQFADALEVVTQSVETLNPLGTGPSLDFSDPDNSMYIPAL